MEIQSVQQNNKSLIDKVRKGSNKKKSNYKLITVLWVLGIIVAAVLVLFVIFLAIKPVEHDPYSQTINLTLTSEDTFKNSEEIQKLKFPSDIVEYNLIVKNDLQNSYDVFLRFKALTYVGDESKENITILEMNEENAENFYYDEGSDTWYYLGVIAVGEELTICDRIGTSGEKTNNEYANATVNFYVLIDAVKATSEGVWSDEESNQWREMMKEKGYLQEEPLLEDE